MILSLSFVFGIFCGSFLNSVIFRLHSGEGFLFSRSHCLKCGRKLGFWDLLPLLSFLALKGKCRYCKKKISFQYPLVETATALLFSLIAFFGFGILQTLFLLVLASFFIVIFVYDLKHYLILDKVVLPAVVIAFLYNYLFNSSWIYGLLGAFGASFFFFLLVFVSRGRWMGAGDIRLMFLIGLVLGWPNILAALFLGFLSGAIIGLGLVLFSKKTLRSEVPFGPFLIGGAFAAFFWGEKLINWYFSFL